MLAEALRGSAAAFALNLRRPALRRAQVSFGLMWAGEWAATVALGVIAFRDGGAGAVALVAAARMLPAALVAPFAAVLADRSNRELTLAAVGLARALALGIAAAVLAAGAPVGWVYVLVAVATVAQTLYRPAHSALLPSVCGTPHELTSANVVRGLLDSLATLLGPLGAAALLAADGPALVLAACAAASLLAGLLVVRLPYEHADVPARRADGPGVAEGLRTIARDRDMRLLTALTSVQTFTRGAVTVLLVVVAIDLLAGDDADVGLLNAAIGLGALAGSLAASAMSWRGRLARCLAAGVALWGAPLVLLGALTAGWSATLAFALVGVGNALVDIGVFTLLARLARDRVMARVFAAFEAALTLAVALGAAVTPLLIALLGEQGALVAIGAFGPLAAAAAWGPLRVLDRRMAVRDADIRSLQRVPMLTPLPQATIECLAAGLEHASYAPRTVVFTAGESGDRYFVVFGGVAEVLDGDACIARLGEGEGFGEIALLRDQPRANTIRVAAQGPLEVGTLTRERFISAVTGYSSSRAAAAKTVATRLGEPLGDASRAS
jgi:MFS family permease